MIFAVTTPNNTALYEIMADTIDDEGSELRELKINQPTGIQLPGTNSIQ